MEQNQRTVAALLPIFRVTVLSLSFVLALIVMGLSAHLTSFTVSFEGEAIIFALLAVTTAGLAILTLPVMLVVDFLCKRTFTSMVLVELIWFSILWMLWLSVGIDGGESINISFPGGCEGFVNNALTIACHDSVGIEALSFLNFVLLLAYSMMLLVFATINRNRGHSVWTSSIKQINITSAKVTALGSSKMPRNRAHELHSRIPSCT